MSPSPAIEESYDDYENRDEVASNKEIVLIFSIFLFVLIILYPDEMLRKQVLDEKSNYELTGVYLENMLRLESGNTNLMLATANVSLERGNLDLAEKLLNVLRKNNNPAIKKQLEQIEFKLLKAQIANSDDPQYKAQKEKRLSESIKLIAQAHLFDKKDALVWYRDAMALSQKKAAHIFLESLSDSDNTQELGQCVYTMTEAQDKAKRIACAEKLAQKGGKSTKKWLIAAWRLYAEDGNYEKSAEILKKLVKIDPAYRDILADTQSAAGEFKKSADLYMLLYRTSGSYEGKKEYLLKAIGALEDGKLYTQAAALVQKHEDNYLHDETMTQKLIKRYLSMDNVQAARGLSLKLLEREK